MSRVGKGPTLSVGIDISTKTGFAVVGTADGSPFVNHFDTIQETALKGLPRAIKIADRVLERIDALLTKPDIVILEGYGFANQFSLVGLVEIGTLIRVGLIQRKIPAGLLTPTGLKKWVTGSGNAKKNMMLLEVFKRWGVQALDDNQADAIGLAMAGLGYSNAISCTREEQKTLSLITLFSTLPTPVTVL